MAYRRPAETRKDRVNQAIANYAARDSDNAPIKRNDPQPVSGRRLVWYGWKNARRSGVFPYGVGKINTYQCSPMFKNGTRCQKRSMPWK